MTSWKLLQQAAHDLQISARTLGRGSEYLFPLPGVLAVSTKSSWAKQPPIRVLCVDDNHDVADSEVEMLSVFGFNARACYDGRSALREAADFQPSVCLLDMNMPGMDGDELAVRLREQEGGPPPVLVAVTAKSDEESWRRMWNAGVSIQLVKPVDPEVLVTIIASAGEVCASNSLG